MRPDDCVDQEGREEDEINQFFDAIPEMIAEVHPATNGNPKQDQGEIRQQEQSSLHGAILASAPALDDP